MLRLPNPCLAVLVGSPASGSSTWAPSPTGQVVSAHPLRALVGRNPADVEVTHLAAFS